MTTDVTELTCDECGGSLSEGYERRELGTDPATGYTDIELVCHDCSEKPLHCDRGCDCPSCLEDVRYDCADSAMDLAEGF